MRIVRYQAGARTGCGVWTDGDMIARPSDAIEWLSSIITLHPGDCLMTGTPAGCGTFMVRPRFLQPGDVGICKVNVNTELRAAYRDALLGDGRPGELVDILARARQAVTQATAQIIELLGSRGLLDRTHAGGG